VHSVARAGACLCLSSRSLLRFVRSLLRVCEVSIALGALGGESWRMFVDMENLLRLNAFFLEQLRTRYRWCLVGFFFYILGLFSHFFCGYGELAAAERLFPLKQLICVTSNLCSVAQITTNQNPKPSTEQRGFRVWERLCANSPPRCCGM